MSSKTNDRNSNYGKKIEGDKVARVDGIISDSSVANSFTGRTSHAYSGTGRTSHANSGTGRSSHATHQGSFTSDLIASFGPSFGSSHPFYLLLLQGVLLGILLGVISLIWQITILEGLRLWRGELYYDLSSLDAVGFFKGEPYYVAVTALAGLISSGIQSIPFFRFPRSLRYLFAEVRDPDESKKPWLCLPR